MIGCIKKKISPSIKRILFPITKHVNIISDRDWKIRCCRCSCVVRITGHVFFGDRKNVKKMISNKKDIKKPQRRDCWFINKKTNHLVTKCSHADINGSIQLYLKNIFLKLELLLGGSQKVNPETNLRAIFPYYISTYKAQSIFYFRSHLLYEYYTIFV